MKIPDPLQAALADLEEALPRLLVAYPDPAEFWPAFAGQADVIEDNAGTRAGYVSARIRAMLSAHGLSDPVSSESESA